MPGQIFKWLSECFRAVTLAERLALNFSQLPTLASRYHDVRETRAAPSKSTAALR